MLTEVFLGRFVSVFLEVVRLVGPFREGLRGPALVLSVVPAQDRLLLLGLAPAVPLALDLVSALEQLLLVVVFVHLREVGRPHVLPLVLLLRLHS